MGIKDRRTENDRRTAHLGVPKGVATLNPTEDLLCEEVTVGGIRPAVPYSFGSDGDQHHLAEPVIFGGTNVAMFSHH